ncbi:MAG TPA: hypothetical protein VGH53_23000 [Streptosporangiaceae bacterium]
MTERLAFVTMFTVMAAFVVGLTVLAVKTGAGRGLPLVAGGAPTNPIGSGQEPCLSSKNAVVGGANETRPVQPSGRLNARLTAALLAALGSNRADVSAGVIDTATGAEALYHPSEHYHAAGIATADILAALLYQHQLAGTPIGSTNAGLAAEMIENGSRTAASSLWQAIGRGAGLVTANRALGLRHTIPGPGNAWRLTGTTLADQLRLLASLATTRSALSLACRHFELGLMAGVAAGQRWGVPSAASPGTSYAATDGWQADPRRFAVNSIGVIYHAGHELLVVVLSRNWPTQAAGRSAVRTAAVAAVSSMAGSP